jgi:hypothetical protein
MILHVDERQRRIQRPPPSIDKSRRDLTDAGRATIPL